MRLLVCEHRQYEPFVFSFSVPLTPKRIHDITLPKNHLNETKTAEEKLTPVSTFPNSKLSLFFLLTPFCFSDRKTGSVDRKTRHQQHHDNNRDVVLCLFNIRLPHHSLAEEIQNERQQKFDVGTSQFSFDSNATALVRRTRKFRNEFVTRPLIMQQIKNVFLFFRVSCFSFSFYRKLSSRNGDEYN